MKKIKILILIFSLSSLLYGQQNELLDKARQTRETYKSIYKIILNKKNDISSLKKEHLEKISLFNYIINFEIDSIIENIVNGNTCGYKKIRFLYSEIPFSRLEKLKNRTAKNNFLNNVKRKVFNQGSLQETGIQSDLAITGNGFFILDKNGKEFYTRNGAFILDKSGRIIHKKSKAVLQGYKACVNSEGEKYITNADSIRDLIIPLYGKVPPRPTTVIKLNQNLDQRITIKSKANNIIISAGFYTFFTEEKLLFVFRKIRKNKWCLAIKIPDSSGSSWIRSFNLYIDKNNKIPLKNVILKFSRNGLLSSISDLTGKIKMQTGPLRVSMDYNFLNEQGDLANRNIKIFMGTAGRADGITQFALPTATKRISQNGFGAGYLENYSIDKSGVISGHYTSGYHEPLGQIALAIFVNQESLNAVNNILFKSSLKTSLPCIGSPQSSGRGEIFSGYLETSNVEYEEERARLQTAINALKYIKLILQKKHTQK